MKEKNKDQKDNLEKMGNIAIIIQSLEVLYIR